MVNLVDAVKRAITICDLKSEKDFALILGISAPDFSKRKKLGTLLPLIVEWGISEKVNLDWLLTGQGSPHLNNDGPKPSAGNNEAQTLFGIPEPRSGPFNAIEIDSGNSIRQLIDKFFASDIDKEFVDIERLSPAQYREFVVYVKGMARGLELSSKSNAGSDRRKIERRTKDQPSKYPKAQDRRNGSDRRKACCGK